MYVRSGTNFITIKFRRRAQESAEISEYNSMAEWRYRKSQIVGSTPTVPSSGCITATE